MKHKKFLSLPLFWTFILFGLFSINAKAQQITPEVELEVVEDGYVVHFTLPSYSIDIANQDDDDEFGVISDPCGIFSVINMDADYDITDIPGYPELPFFPLNLIIPNGAEYEVTFEPGDIESVDIYDYIEAAIGDGSVTSECYNTEYYVFGYDTEYPYGFYRDFYVVNGPYNITDAEGLTLSIHPFAYYPHESRVDVLLSGTFYIKFNTDNLINVLDRFHYEPGYFPIWMYFDNFNGEQYPNELDRGDYLIIAANSNMSIALDIFVDYRNSQGYNVEVVYLNNAVGNVSTISNIINERQPDYVLLVGSLDDIPPFEGTSDIECPYSDDGYHPMVGRWVISENSPIYPTLMNIVCKTKDSEQQYLNTSHDAVLFSGIDTCRNLISKKFYNTIKKIRNKHLDDLNINTTLYKGYNSNYNYATMSTALAGAPSFFIYNGHGDYVYDMTHPIIISTAISAPYYIAPNFVNHSMYKHIYDINNLNISSYSMGFGFACFLNSYLFDKSFGAQWIEANNGGATFYAATTGSLRSANKALSKRIFKQLKQMTYKSDNFQLGSWLYCAEQAYLNALRTPIRHNQVKTYNLIGDPTLYVYGLESGIAEVFPSYSPQKNNIDGENMNIEEILVYDVTGLLIHSYTNTNIENIFAEMEKGIYIMKILYKDSTTETIKIIN